MSEQAYTGFPFVINVNYKNKITPTSIFNIDANQFSANLNALANGTAIIDNAITTRMVSDELKDMMIQGVKNSVDHYSDLPSTEDDGTIYIVKETDTSGANGFYKFDGTNWNKIADYVSSADITILQSEIDTINQTLPLKADKMPTATENDIMTFDNSGNIQDSGININYYKMANYYVSNLTDLQSAINTLATSNGGSGGSIMLKDGIYSGTSAIILPETTERIVIESNNAELIRPDSDACIKADSTVSSNYIYSIIGMKFNGQGKTGNYPLMQTQHGNNQQNLYNFYLHKCVFKNNSYHAFYGRIYHGMATENSFFDIDGYAFNGGFLGDGTLFSNNMMVNEGTSTNNEHGLLYSDDGNGIYIMNCTFKDNTGSLGDIIYGTYGGTAFYFRAFNVTANTQPNELPAGKYLIKIDKSPNNNHIVVQNNTGLFVGLNKECNLTTDIGGNNGKNYILIEGNFTTPMF